MARIFQLSFRGNGPRFEDHETLVTFDENGRIISVEPPNNPGEYFPGLIATGPGNPAAWGVHFYYPPVAGGEMPDVRLWDCDWFGDRAYVSTAEFVAEEYFGRRLAIDVDIELAAQCEYAAWELEGAQ